MHSTLAEHMSLAEHPLFLALTDMGLHCNVSSEKLESSEACKITGFGLGSKTCVWVEKGNHLSHLGIC
jgi:hypothetical protein